MPRQRRRLPLPEEWKPPREIRTIDDEGLTKFVGRMVGVIQDTYAPVEKAGDVYVEGELSYHHPDFQVIDKEGVRHRINPRPIGYLSNPLIFVKGRKPRVFRFIDPSQQACYQRMQ